ncbi:hypothetical protein HY947_04090 [Candidatus Gottesmanbacteria bacterium]|nr:hypothetical protein [Candidatus Gottesmanbacteria bacterium]
MARKLLILVLICLITLGAIYVIQKNKCKPWGCFEFEGDTSFLLKETYFTSNTVFRGLFSNDSVIMRIDRRILSKSESPENEFNARVMRFSEMFTKAPAPYPGDISDAIVCPDNMIPEKKEIPIQNGKLTYFLAHYGKRQNFGVCSMVDSAGIGVYAVLYCEKDNELQQVEFFSSGYTSGEEKYLNKLVQSIWCKS